MRTLDIHKGMLVFITGMGENGHRIGDDMDGHVVKVDAEHDFVSVHWDHPGLAHDPIMRYGAEQFIATVDRNGMDTLILHI